MEVITYNVSNTTSVLNLNETELLYPNVNIPTGDSRFSVREIKYEELIDYSIPKSGNFKIFHAPVEQGVIKILSSKSLFKGVNFLHALFKSHKQILKPIF